MAIIFVSGLIVFYWLVLRRRAKNGATLSTLLWFTYLCLGLSGVFIAATEGILPVFEPNYPATLLLLVCILLNISGFMGFRTQDISSTFGTIRGQKIIENFLIIFQLFAIAFFLPFAISSLTGDPNENRLLLDEKMKLMGSYGFINSVAGAASQLFSSSLVLAFIRFASKREQGRNILRGLILTISSLSYVIYILAYVGRDGVVYWTMTAAMIFLIFREHIDSVTLKRITYFAFFILLLIAIPFASITISRFFDADHGGGWSLFEYFGAQIQNFSDYSSLDRPLTFGFASFPIFMNWGCEIAGLSCSPFLDIKYQIFQQYLDQGKEPWLFGTYVSDLAGDFGNFGALAFVALFSMLAARACSRGGVRRPLTLARLLLILFMFLIPYWGVFYFRFAIANGFIIVNFAFIGFVALLHLIMPIFKIPKPKITAKDH